jgi:hypothetical protein
VGFQALNSSYTIPSRKFLSQTLLPAKFMEIHKKYKKLTKDDVCVTLTTDCWTPCNNESFMALTAHFIDSQLFEIKNVLLKVSSSDLRHMSTNLAQMIKKITTVLKRQSLTIYSDAFWGV